MRKNTTTRAKATKGKAKPTLRDLKPGKADATKGGATTRFDPYKNFKFRP